MHIVVLGVMKMILVSIWFDFSNLDDNYYIGKKLREEINKIIEEITPPDNVTRATRSLQYGRNHIKSKKTILWTVNVNV